MTSEQAKLFEVLQGRIEAHFQEGETEEARRMAGKAVGAARRALDPEQEHFGIYVSLLRQTAEINRHEGKMEVAEALFREALEYAGAHAGDLDPENLARLHNSYAVLLDLKGEEAEAAPHYEEAISRLESLEPAPEEDIANIANNLGMIYRRQGTFDRAEGFYQQAVHIFERLDGEESLNVATVCNNLGSLYWAWGHPEMARDYHVRALKIRRDQLPKDHHDIGQSACNLAAVYQDLGDFEKAGKNYERALGILKKSFDEDPDSYYAVASNYADLLEANGQAAKAEVFRQRTGEPIPGVGENSSAA